jgi:hypothetical protein
MKIGWRQNFPSQTRTSGLHSAFEVLTFKYKGVVQDFEKLK